MKRERHSKTLSFFTKNRRFPRSGSGFPPGGVAAGGDSCYNEAVTKGGAEDGTRNGIQNGTKLQRAAQTLPQGKEPDPAAAGGRAGGEQQKRLPLGVGSFPKIKNLLMNSRVHYFQYRKSKIFGDTIMVQRLTYSPVWWLLYP